MYSYGMNFGSHTVNHALIGSLKSKEIEYELEESKRTIEEKVCETIKFLSLPHGSYDNRYKMIAQNSGYDGGFCSDPGLNDCNTDSYFFRRINIQRNMSDITFRMLIDKNALPYVNLILKNNVMRTLKKIIGEKKFLKMYNKIFKVIEK